MSSGTAEEKTEAAASAAGAPSGGGNKLVLILTLVNTLVTVVIVAILLISFKQQKNTASVADMQTKPEHGGEAAPKEGEKSAEKGHGEGGEKEKAEAAKVADVGKMVTLEQFTVNLATPGGASSKFVRVNVSLEVPTAESETEVNSKMPQIRNAIIDLFNSKRAGDLGTADGREYLKEEIKNALNGFLSQGKVKGVFFTNFALTG